MSLWQCFICKQRHSLANDTIAQVLNNEQRFHRIRSCRTSPDHCLEATDPRCCCGWNTEPRVSWPRGRSLGCQRFCSWAIKNVLMVVTSCTVIITTWRYSLRASHSGTLCKEDGLLRVGHFKLRWEMFAMLNLLICPPQNVVSRQLGWYRGNHAEVIF